MKYKHFFRIVFLLVCLCGSFVSQANSNGVFSNFDSRLYAKHFFTLYDYEALGQTDLNIIQRFEDADNRGLDQEMTSTNRSSLFYLVIILFLSVLLVTLFIWNYFLRREVQLLTKSEVKSINEDINNLFLIDLFSTAFQEIISYLPISFFISNQQGHFVFTDKDFEKQFFNEKEECNISDVLKGDEYKKLKDAEKSSLSNPEKLFKVQINIKNISLELLVVPIRIKGSDEINFAHIIINPEITKSFNIDNLKYNRLFKTILDSITDIVFVKDIQGRYIFGNNAFFDFCKKSEAEILAKTDREVFGKDIAEKVERRDKKVFETEEVWEGYSWNMDLGEFDEKFELSKIPLYNHSSEMLGLLGVVRDKTKHISCQQELLSATQRAEESDRVRSSFLANISHEIRNPMNSIIGFSDLLADPDLTLDQRIEFIDMVRTSGYDLLELVDDIVDFSKIEVGQIHLKYRDFNLNLVFRETFSFGKSKIEQLNKDSITFNCELGVLEDVFEINSDPFQLRRVLQNIINASIKYSSTDSLYFGYKVQGEVIIFFIKNDNWIVPDTILNLFLSDNSIDYFISSEIEDTVGISLIVSEKIAQILGGKFVVDGVSLEKIDYYFSIPYKKVESKPAKLLNKVALDVPDWSGKKILVAEDEEVNLMLLDEILSETKVNIIRAENGKIAIDLYEKNKDIDLVLMDIRMPVLNGVDASIKILEKDPNAIIIAQTAYTMLEDKELFFKVGIKTVLTKPLDPSELYFTCNKYLK